MDMNKPFKYLIEHRAGRRKGHKEIAAHLAPLEEQDKGAAARRETTAGELHNHLLQQPGAIIVGGEGHSLSNDIAEGQHVKQVLGMEPVVLVILGFMLAFIAFIAWQISKMPVE